MDPDRWRQVKDICAALLDHDIDRRRTVMRDLCAGDAALEADVEELLRFATQGGGVLEQPVWARTASGVGTATMAWLPDRIGHYRILRLVGEGGMGTVFEAEQDRPRRTVALKLVKPGIADREVLRRFEFESQALGRLQHPGIAQIYEAGTAETAVGIQPFLAMEFIHGQTLREYVEAHRPTVPQRLDLMLQVCDAVHHAHQRGVIHRDLKPGNILVDENGRTKVLDFGVARLTDADAYVSRHTDVGQLLGTLAYMSPEQVVADPLGLDTRSDVYTLGVILYELLAGALPYTARGADLTRAIREDDPRALGDVDGSFRGDLETIAATALDKDKERRYNSAAALAADIRRYLNDEPIAARPPTTAYQLRKFAKRNRVLVTSVAVIFVVLVVGIVGTTIEAIQARRAQLDAQAAQQTAQAVNAFLSNDLLAQASASTQAGPNTKPDPDIKVRTALDRAAATIGERFKAQPLVEASIRDTISHAYRDLGLYGDAQRHAELSLKLRRRLLGDSDPATLDSLDAVASLEWLEGKYAEAEPVFEEIARTRRLISGEGSSDTLIALNNLGLLYVYEGKYSQAEPILEHTLEARRRLSGDEHRETLTSMANLAQLYDREGKYPAAASLFERTIEAERRVWGPEHPETLTSMNNLSSVYRSQGRYADAEALLNSTLALRRRVLGEEHPSTLTVLNNLGNIYMNQGRAAEAETLFTKLLATRRRVLGETHPNTLLTENNLANVLRFEGRYADARALVANALTTQRRVYGEDNPDTLLMAGHLGFILALEKKGTEGQELLLETLETRTRVSGETHPETILVEERLAFVHATMGDYESAEPLLARAYTSRRHALSETHPDTLAAGCALGFAQVKRRKFAEAESTLRETLSLFEKGHLTTWQRHNCEVWLGASVIGQGRDDEGRRTLRAGYEALLHDRALMGASNAFYLDEAQRALR